MPYQNALKLVLSVNPITFPRPIDFIEKATGKKVPYEIGLRREGDVEQVWAQAEKAKEVLGWQTMRSLEDSLADAWRWQQKVLSQ